MLSCFLRRDVLGLIAQSIGSDLCIAMRVQVALQNQHCRNLVDHLFSLVTPHIRLYQRPPCAGRCEPLILKRVITVPLFEQFVRKREGIIRLNAIAAVHIARHAEHELYGLVAVCQPD
ncbi:hypothetical protein SDC9_197706 [bioreactor metagenome]|uniref:Uncharacterized protein n=1 Tax=bioreactor metagenome TaxID=1076179 RepID=A0A645IG43_9ZZZZ